MIQKTFSGEAQYSPAILVYHGQYLDYEIVESVATFIAHISIQRIMDISDPAQPNDADSRWVTVSEFDMVTGPTSNYSNVGAAWFRVAILTGDYTSGSAILTMKAVGY